MFSALLTFARHNPDKLQLIETVIRSVARPNDLTFNQACLLGAVAQAYDADLILDIGTGHGTSAYIFSAVRPQSRVHTFDLYDHVDATIRSAIAKLECGHNITFELANLCHIDFGPIVSDANNVVVFWDAHGLQVASHILCHVMPLIADRRHIVLCHDMPHVDFQSDLSYDGKALWRGMEDYYANPERTAFVVLGWTVTVVDQIIPILDFCARNGMTFRSADQSIHGDNSDRRSELRSALALEADPTYNIGYFTMNDTASRNFPSSRNR
jgi:hypothetical protein